MNSNSGNKKKRIRNKTHLRNQQSFLFLCQTANSLGRYRNHQPARKRNSLDFHCAHQSKNFLLTGGAYSVENICKELCLYQMQDAVVSVGSNLSYENESIVSGTAETLTKQSFPALSVMLIEHTNSQSKIVTHGLPDESFIRGNVPMTKSEVRSISLSKLQLEPHDIVYDIGAGTGSVAVEIALQIPHGCVYAVEKRILKHLPCWSKTKLNWVLTV